MKSLLLFLALILFYQSDNPNITTRYDRFKDTTSLVLNRNVPSLGGVVDLGGGSYYVKPGFSASDAVYFHVIAVSPGKVLTRDAKVSLALTSRTGQWVFLKQPNTLRMILNGSERLNFGEMIRVNSDVVSGSVIEQLAVVISLDTIERLSKAKRIEVQIGLEEFEFSSGFVDDLREFVRRFPAKK